MKECTALPLPTGHMSSQQNEYNLKCVIHRYILKIRMNNYAWFELFSFVLFSLLASLFLFILQECCVLDIILVSLQLIVPKISPEITIPAGRQSPGQLKDKIDVSAMSHSHHNE